MSVQHTLLRFHSSPIKMSSDNSSSDDEVLQLSAATMDALLEFYKEQQEREDRLREIEEGNIPDTFEENWVRRK